MSDRDYPRPVVHWEMLSPDPERLSAFYRDLFHWSITAGPIHAVGAGFGGPEPGPGGHLRQADRSGVTLYVQVRDLRESLDRAEALGGRAAVEPFDVPGGPTLAGIDDPDGNRVMLVQQ